MTYATEDLVYLAAFIDGEGSIMVSKTSHKGNRSGVSFYANISITNTSESVIDYLANTFGFTKQLRHVAGQTSSHGIKSTKDCWVLRLSFNKASELLTKILPYLRIKRPQAELAIQVQKLKAGAESTNYNDEIVMAQFEVYKACRRLNSPNATEEGLESLRPKIRPPAAEVTAKAKGCAIAGCTKDHYGTGLCRFHWRQVNEQDMPVEFIQDRKCAICSGSLSCARKDALYCSHKCNLKAYRRRKPSAPDGSA